MAGNKPLDRAADGFMEGNSGLQQQQAILQPHEPKQHIPAHELATRHVDSPRLGSDQSPELLCPICTSVVRDPMQMKCCGNVFCKACITELQKLSRNCPVCENKGTGFRDITCTRLPYHLTRRRVMCVNHSNGCDWVGELRFLDEHLYTCDHVLLPCTNKCKAGSTLFQIYRIDLTTHLKERCPNRSYQCPHCREEGKHCDIITTHLQTCPQLEVPCPNEGCSEMLPRCDVPNHLQTCPFEVSPSSQPREKNHTPPERVQLTLDDCATFGPVRGCTIVAERSFPITQRAEVFNWPEYGITISAPENSIPANTQSVLLNVRVSLSGPFQLGASKLMSAVYWICPNIRCKFANPLEFTVEHCAHLKLPDDHTKLTFLRTKCNQEDLPYKFKEIGGQFTAHSGTVALRSFSGVAVGSKSAESYPPPMKYVARILTQQTHVTEWKTLYAVLKDLKSFRAFDSEKKFASSGPFTTTYTAIKFKEDTVRLDLPVSGVTMEDGNWKIRPLVPPRLSIPDGESYEPFRDLDFSECSVVLEWVGLGEPSTTLHHVVALSGTADSDDFFALHVNPAQRLQQARQGSLSTQPRETKHRAIESLIPDLTTIITNKSSPVFFADHLASKDFLSTQCRMNILEKKGASPHDTVSTLLNAVVVTVKTASSPEESAKHFDNFVTIIRKGLELEDLAQKLINRCAELDEATSSMEASASFTTAPGVHQVKFTPQQNPLLATGSSQKRKVANAPATVDSSPVPQAKLLKLKRKDALIMTLPFHKDWQTIGALLEVEEEKIRAIQDEENNVSSKDCLRVLLDEWLKSTDPPPSWQALAEAVEPFDTDAADRIRRTYSNL